MRTSLFSVLAALVSIASTLPTGHSAHQGSVAGRDTAKARSPPAALPNVQRDVPCSDPLGHPARAVAVSAPSKKKLERRRRDYAPRAEVVASKPSGKPDRRRHDFAPRAEVVAAKPSGKPDRRRSDFAPRAEVVASKPSGKPDRRRHDFAPRAEVVAAKPSGKPDRRRSDFAPRAEVVAAKPSGKPDRRRSDSAPRAEVVAAKPSGKPDRRDVHAPRTPQHGHAKRSQDEQNPFGGYKIGEGLLGWLDEDQCPAPLSACPVRGARDPDAFECVDLESDLYSCGGCAADDIACVFPSPPKSLSPCFSHCLKISI